MITTNNCETWFLLYADGELSAAEQAAVEQFLEAYPDFRSSFDQLQALKFFPDEAVVFPDHALLQQEPEIEMVDESPAKGENQYRFEPDHSICFPDKQQLYRYEKSVHQLVEGHGSQDVKSPVVPLWRGRWGTARMRNWGSSGVRYVAAAVMVTAIGMLWFFFSQYTVEGPQDSIAAVQTDPIKTTVDPLSAVARSGKEGNADAMPSNSGDQIITGKKQNSNNLPTPLPSIVQANVVDDKASNPESIVTPLKSISPTRSTLSPAIRSFVINRFDTERIAAERLPTDRYSTERLSAERAAALASEAEPMGQDNTIAIHETKAEASRTGLRKLLDRLNARLDQEVEYDEGKKYIQVASFNIPLSKEIKK